MPNDLEDAGRQHLSFQDGFQTGENRGSIFQSEPLSVSANDLARSLDSGGCCGAVGDDQSRCCCWHGRRGFILDKNRLSGGDLCEWSDVREHLVCVRYEYALVPDPGTCVKCCSFVQTWNRCNEFSIVARVVMHRSPPLFHSYVPVIMLVQSLQQGCTPFSVGPRLPGVAMVECLLSQALLRCKVCGRRLLHFLVAAHVGADRSLGSRECVRRICRTL